jgi:Ca2+-transporting ATPase
MTIAALWVDGALHELSGPNDLHSRAAYLLGKAALASAMRPTDPMDRAVRDFAQDLAIDTAPGGAPLSTHPLQPNLLAVIQAWAEDDRTTVVAAKGAPEAIFRLCHMDRDTHDRMHGVVAQMADRGLRVLCVASCHEAPVPEDLSGYVNFEGSSGSSIRFERMSRPLWPSRGGRRQVAMITGDYPQRHSKSPGVAASMPTPAFSPAPRSRLSTSTRARTVKRVRIFARVLPEQSSRSWKLSGQRTRSGDAGDGVNDAPALSRRISSRWRARNRCRAGGGGYRPLDDSFASIVGGVEIAGASSPTCVKLHLWMTIHANRRSRPV